MMAGKYFLTPLRRVANANGRKFARADDFACGGFFERASRRFGDKVAFLAPASSVHVGHLPASRVRLVCTMEGLDGRTVLSDVTAQYRR
jgi:hypothetical protein